MRSPSAIAVSVTFAYPPRGNVLVDATKRFGTPCTAPSGSTTPSRGVALIRVVPMKWCDEEDSTTGPPSARAGSYVPHPARASASRYTSCARTTASASSSRQRQCTSMRRRPRRSRASDSVMRLSGCGACSAWWMTSIRVNRLGSPADQPPRPRLARGCRCERTSRTATPSSPMIARASVRGRGRWCRMTASRISSAADTACCCRGVSGRAVTCSSVRGKSSMLSAGRPERSVSSVSARWPMTGTPRTSRMSYGTRSATSPGLAGRMNPPARRGWSMKQRPSWS